MAADVLDLREFYLSPLGQGVRALLRERLARLWPDLARETVLGLGYATPLLRPWLGAARVLAVMPPAQGAAYWPREGANRVVLAKFSALPFEEESVHRAIVLHGLEAADDVPAFLREVWRVLKGNGRALLLVPHRRGLWAHNDSTPFGTGQPFSSAQLRALVREQGFVINRCGGALFAPPFLARVLPKAAAAAERVLAPLCGRAGGLLWVEVSKQLFAPLVTQNRVRTPRLVLPMPFPVSSGPVPT
jgi:SAM-dependent methyltransferase